MLVEQDHYLGMQAKNLWIVDAMIAEMEPALLAEHLYLEGTSGYPAYMICCEHGGRVLSPLLSSVRKQAKVVHCCRTAHEAGLPIAPA